MAGAMARLACVVVLVALTIDASGQAAPQVERRSRADAQRLFELYDRGDFDGLRRALVGFQNTLTNWVFFKDEAQDWIGQSPNGDRRRLVAATVALELASVERHQFKLAAMLVEVGCELLRPVGRAQPGELEWQLASVALVQSLGYHDFLRSAGPVRDVEQERRKEELRVRGGGQPREMDFVGHLQHATTRFPDEPAFRLAFGVTMEATSIADVTMAGTSGDSAGTVPFWLDGPEVERLATSGRPTIRKIPQAARMDRPSAETLLALDQTLFPARVSAHLWALIDLFRPLASHPVVGPEAQLRVGYTHMRLARPNLALDSFRVAAGTSTDPYVRYLARYFGASVLKATDRREEAMATLRAALGDVPRSQSATFMLAPMLLGAGARDEAADLLEGALAQPLAVDPLKFYRGTDPDRWLRHRAALRAILQ